MTDSPDSVQGSRFANRRAGTDGRCGSRTVANETARRPVRGGRVVATSAGPQPRSAPGWAAARRLGREGRLLAARVMPGDALWSWGNCWTRVSERAVADGSGAAYVNGSVFGGPVGERASGVIVRVERGRITGDRRRRPSVPNGRDHADGDTLIVAEPHGHDLSRTPSARRVSSATAGSGRTLDAPEASASTRTVALVRGRAGPPMRSRARGGGVLRRSARPRRVRLRAGRRSCRPSTSWSRRLAGMDGMLMLRRRDRSSPDGLRLGGPETVVPERGARDAHLTVRSTRTRAGRP